jgi:hypothetical protein
MPGVIFNLSYSLFTTIIFLQIQSNFLYKLEETVSKYRCCCSYEKQSVEGSDTSKAS